MGEVFVITSGKGGVGKTTSTANIGAGLAAADKKTVLIDTDIGLRNLDVVMVVLGGMGSMLGSILSATVLTILPEATRSFDSYRMVVYSLVLILMMIFRPGGLLGSYDFSMSRIVEKIMNGELFQKKAKEGKDHE